MLGEELWLARESPLPAAERERLARFDGSETTCWTDASGTFRLISPVGAADVPTHLLSGPRALPLGHETRTLNADGSLGGGDAAAAAITRAPRKIENRINYIMTMPEVSGMG